MKTVGLVISHKENEKRRALIPEHICNIKHPRQIFIETGYGDVLGFSDEDYAAHGVNICSREEALQKDIICDPKIGDGEYLEYLHNQTIFGWIHAVQNRNITDKIIKSKLTAYAWEDMYEDGRHSFWRNNEIAGEAAVFHAYMCHGVLPYHTKAAVLGRGNTARGAIKTLNFMGAEVTQFDKHTENLFRKEIGNYDVIINAVLWDVSRKDHIIYKTDLKNMKKNALIVDISCDKNGGIETSIPTTIDNPTYCIEGVTHYVVDHTPSLFWKTTTESLSHEFAKFIDDLITDSALSNCVLSNCHIFESGNILDERINKFQNR